MPRKLRGEWDSEGHYLGEDAMPDSEGDEDLRITGLDNLKHDSKSGDLLPPLADFNGLDEGDD